MPRISVKSENQARPVEEGQAPVAVAGGEILSYFNGDRDPLHLHAIRLDAGGGFTVEAAAIDRLFYVWEGTVRAGGEALPAGSVLIVERGRSHSSQAENEGAVLLCFASASAPGTQGGGGNVLTLAAASAPHSSELGGTPGLGGTMYADAASATNALWLHANQFPPMEAPGPDDTTGVHSHSEDEIIFVVSGGIRLGSRLYGPGTAVAIAADTLYSFTAGPEGLHFINFRAGMPGDIRFANGTTISETGYWRDKLPRPSYRHLAA